MIRLLLADDHPVVRAGLKALFIAEPDIDVVAEAGTAEAAITEVARVRPDVVLMDLQFGGGLQGVDATRKLRELAGPPYVLILTTYGTDTDILGAVEAGASGYLLKDSDPAELIAAVRAAAAGESALAPRIATRLLTQVRTPEARLSQRESEVLALVAAGKSNREIGRDLFLSEATVKSHLVHIFAKLDVTSRTAAVAKARASGAIR
ncbi:MAG: response regulator [Thermomicrobiales bacterium]